MKFKTEPTEQAKGKYERFDVHIEGDDGKLLMTIRAWRLSRFKHVIPPQSYMRNGALFNVVDLPNHELVEQLRDSVLKKVDPDGSRRAAMEDE